MNRTRSLVIVVSLLCSGHVAAAQDLSRYRAFTLESSLDAVVTAGGGRTTDAKTLHTRPAMIRSLQWRAPYVSSTETSADPVTEIAFTFYNDSLYQVVVTYERGRTDGLTNADVLDALSATYGPPISLAVKNRPPAPAEVFPDSIVLAQWEQGESLMTLVRGSYTPDFQLIVVSKRLSMLARAAIKESARLDALEAPRRESDQRKKDADDASAARETTRVTNKKAFRP